MSADLSPSDIAKKACAEAAAALVEPGMNVGLGTGSTAAFLVARLGERRRDEGLEITAVATSSRTADQARDEGIRVVSLDEAGRLDLTIDGADEIDGEFALIKGGGGAHLQEKVVAMASDRMVVIADASKHVEVLGAFPLPVEVLRFGLQSSRAQIADVLAQLGHGGADITLRGGPEAPFVTDEGNLVLDLHLGRISDPAGLSLLLNQIPGVVENGLFIGIADSVVTGYEDGRTDLRHRPDAAPKGGLARRVLQQGG